MIGGVWQFDERGDRTSVLPSTFPHSSMPFDFLLGYLGVVSLFKFLLCVIIALL